MTNTKITHNLKNEAKFHIAGSDLRVYCTCGEDIFTGEEITLLEALQLIAEHNGENVSRTSF